MLPPKFSARQVADTNAIARWLGGWRGGARLAALVGAVRVRLADDGIDPFAARAVVRVDGVAIAVTGGSGAVRAIAQQLLGGPPELDAPRPLTLAERAVFSLLVATALEDLGVPGEVWPDDARVEDPVRVTLAVELGTRPMTVAIEAPRAIVMRGKPRLAAWVDATQVELVVVVARSALAGADFAVGDVITVERAGPELAFADGGVPLRTIPGSVVATVASEYVPRDMALPDDAHLDLTVAFGTARLSVRQLSELAVGQTVTLGRPVGGPYELRVAGRVVGHGELVDVDGELAVRVVSLGESS